MIGIRSTGAAYECKWNAPSDWSWSLLSSGIDSLGDRGPLERVLMFHDWSCQCWVTYAQHRSALSFENTEISKTSQCEPMTSLTARKRRSCTNRVNRTRPKRGAARPTSRLDSGGNKIGLWTIQPRRTKKKRLSHLLVSCCRRVGFIRRRLRDVVNKHRWWGMRYAPREIQCRTRRAAAGGRCPQCGTR